VPVKQFSAVVQVTPDRISDRHAEQSSEETDDERYGDPEHQHHFSFIDCHFHAL